MIQIITVFFSGCGGGLEINPQKTSSTRNLQSLHPDKLTWNPQNGGLEKVTPFKDGNSWYLCQISGV